MRISKWIWDDWSIRGRSYRPICMHPENYFEESEIETVCFLLDFLLIIPNYPQQKFNLTQGNSSIRCGQGETIPVRAVILSYTHQQYWKKGHHVYTSTWNSPTICTFAEVLNFAVFSVIKKWGFYAYRQNLYLALFKSVHKKCKQICFVRA